MEYENDCKPGIDLYDLWLILKRKRLLVFAVALFSTGIALSYAVLSPPMYRVHNVLVSNQMQDGDLFIQSEIAATMTILDKLNKLNDFDKEKVFLKMGLQKKDLDVIGAISWSEIKGSSSLWVDIDTTDPKIGLAFMEALPGFIATNPSISNRLSMQKTLLLKSRDNLKAIIDNPTRNLRLTRDAIVYLPSIDLFSLQERYNRVNSIIDKIDQGQIIYFAWKTHLPSKPIGPDRIKMTLLGLAFGCFAGIFLAFFMEWLDKAREFHLSR